MFSNPNLVREGSRLYVRSMVPEFKVHGERLLRKNGAEWREWNPNQSKLGAAIMRGLKTEIPVGASVLYLGAANGATPSFVSDLVGAGGAVFGVEISARAMRDLIRVCEKRENMLPILADGRKPETYANELPGYVDFVFEDVADPAQARILIENARFLRKGGIAMLAVKARCVSSAEQPERVYKAVEAELSGTFETVEKMQLEPYEQDHEFLVLRKR
ncbi:Fibrillarin-like rRNA/tRNA 2'-O-methyltransferase [Candidatus Norongarragalina meridionalis]|nr:Fibrillarin-like rRNA/tRNA 2'-O-methyltransferase [Candidatus Norongarragalina meridionalis]